MNAYQEISLQIELRDREVEYENFQGPAVQICPSRLSVLKSTRPRAVAAQAKLESLFFSTECVVV